MLFLIIRNLALGLPKIKKLLKLKKTKKKKIQKKKKFKKKKKKKKKKLLSVGKKLISLLFFTTFEIF